jgi:hypothetical protein
MSTEDPTNQSGDQESVGDGGAQGAHQGEAEPDTFPREYVQRLRDEAAGHRIKAQRADEAVARLTLATITTMTADVLADPTDLQVTDDLLDEDGWPDPEKIKAAAQELVARKPHLATRRPQGDIGQGARGDEVETVGLAALLRAGAA